MTAIKENLREFNIGIGLALTRRRYKIISLVSGILIFAVLYYFLVAKVAHNSLWTSIMMSGPTFITFSVASILATSALSGILLSMILFKFRLHNKITGKGFLGFIGSGISAFGVGCPTCGAFLFGLIGLPFTLMYFPFKGVELQLFGILILLISIYLTGMSINSLCKPRGINQDAA